MDENQIRNTSDNIRDGNASSSEKVQLTTTPKSGTVKAIVPLLFGIILLGLVLFSVIRTVIILSAKGPYFNYPIRFVAFGTIGILAIAPIAYYFLNRNDHENSHFTIQDISRIIVIALLVSMSIILLAPCDPRNTLCALVPPVVLLYFLPIILVDIAFFTVGRKKAPTSSNHSKERSTHTILWILYFCALSISLFLFSII